jgi:hypothetical protein
LRSAKADCRSGVWGFLPEQKNIFSIKKTESRQPIFPEFFWEEDLPARQLLFFLFIFGRKMLWERKKIMLGCQKSRRIMGCQKKYNRLMGLSVQA